MDRWGTFAGNIFLCIFLLIGTVMTGFIKSELRRQKANEQVESKMTADDVVAPYNIPEYENAVK